MTEEDRRILSRHRERQEVADRAYQAALHRIRDPPEPEPEDRPLARLSPRSQVLFREWVREALAGEPAIIRRLFPLEQLEQWPAQKWRAFRELFPIDGAGGEPAGEENER